MSDTADSLDPTDLVLLERIEGRTGDTLRDAQAALSAADAIRLDELGYLSVDHLDATSGVYRAVLDAAQERAARARVLDELGPDGEPVPGKSPTSKRPPRKKAKAEDAGG